MIGIKISYRFLILLFLFTTDVIRMSNIFFWNHLYFIKWYFSNWCLLYFTVKHWIFYFIESFLQFSQSPFMICFFRFFNMLFHLILWLPWVVTLYCFCWDHIINRIGIWICFIINNLRVECIFMREWAIETRRLVRRIKRVWIFIRRNSSLRIHNTVFGRWLTTFTDYMFW